LQLGDSGTALKMLTNFTALLLLSFSPLSSTTRQKVLKDAGASPFNTKFSELANDTLELWHVPGASIAVVDGANM
jgi:hypothetical protein